MSKSHRITEKAIASFEKYLVSLERAEQTCIKYVYDVRRYMQWSNGYLSQEKLSDWKDHLQNEGKAPTSINSMIASLNAYCVFAKLPIKEGYLSIQRSVFRADERILRASELKKLIICAERLGNEQYALLLYTMAKTGIRVSEVRYITVEALKAGYAEVYLKRKARSIFLSGELCGKLLTFAEHEKIRKGCVFLDAHRQPLTRNQIWRGMKQLCKPAGVAPTKVFPHNLRHLFAEEYYRISHDLVLLSDVLGHSSVETTRIYLTSASAKHKRTLEKMKFEWESERKPD